jgi:tRNA threonylcarbamoyladenosine biosynthesis protein TsaB
MESDEEGYLPFLFCGEISTASRQALSSCLQKHCLFVSKLEAPRRASALAALALQRLRDNQRDDPLMLEPLYLRRPSITKSTRKQPLLGATQ